MDEVLNIVCQLAETLQYVHHQGVVHRDLKSENILITSDGSVKLADFGIALRLDSRRLTFNHLSNAVGTPDYMAPEQVRGERGDSRTDVYSLGVVLYELLTARVLYPADDALEATRRKVQTDPPLVRRARSDVPAQLEAVVYRALRRRPEERYQSMTELGVRPKSEFHTPGGAELRSKRLPGGATSVAEDFSAAPLGHDLAHLDEVTIPVYRPDVRLPKPLGDLPPWRTSIPVFLVVYGVLITLGVLAQFAHRVAPH